MPLRNLFGFRKERDVLAPLTVVGGRSGTTLIMHLLSTCGEIAMLREYPYESQYLAYLLRWAQLVDQPFVEQDDWNPGIMLAGIKSPDGKIGPWPWSDRRLIDVPHGSPTLTQRCFVGTWQQISPLLGTNGRLTNDGRPGAPRYFAEKCLTWVSDGVARLLPSKRIYAIRDPRDIWLSILAFDDKRGFYGFGRRPGQSEPDFRADFVSRLKPQLVAAGQVVVWDSDAVVRYEDLVTDLEERSMRLGKWLGVSFDHRLVERDRERFRHHMTSPTPERSVGRWKTAMSAEENRFFLDQLGPEMERLGYET